jgi:hypothetical protein
MTSALSKSELLPSNPLDLAELVIMDRDWAFDRTADGELIAEFSGVWCNYRVWFSWQEEMHVLLLSCALESKLPKQSLPKVYPLLALVNEKLWVGHFDLCTEDNSVVFRHSLLLRDATGTSEEQIQELLDIAVNECERFYPAFQAAVWGGKSAHEAMEIAVFETIGEA